jgi:pimeloyl-ACP methyl ester carboxylesterase
MSPLFRFVRRGDGHPVLVLPGFTGSDVSTRPLRALLELRGHAVHGWELGRNVGPHPRIVEGVESRLLDLHASTGRQISLVGWSLGGMYARELAHQHPELVRQVVTLCSPFRFRDGDRGHASALYDYVGPARDPFPGRAVDEHERPPLPVPATAIYTRTDGIVRWHSCLERKGPRAENIEVLGTHSGLGCNMAATIAVADRLAQPEGTWAPFRAPWTLRMLFPRPASWEQARRAARAAV